MDFGHADRPRHLCLFLGSLTGGGGAERAMVNLARGLSLRGHKVDVVLGRAEGYFINELPSTVRIIDLKVRSGKQVWRVIPRIPREFPFLAPILLHPKPPWRLGAIEPLATYLKEQHPQCLIAALEYPNLAALLAREISGVRIPIIITARNHLSVETAAEPRTKVTKRLLPLFVRRYYPKADAVVAVSDGVKQDLLSITRMQPGRITTVYNGVIDERVEMLAKQPVDHPWFNDKKVPVILGVGKLKPQKDFETLLRAFRQVRESRPVRLVILGEGKQRSELERLCKHLQIEKDCHMPGFMSNPFTYMGKASVFVLSSAWEGLPNVLIQAMACGTPVISTDCPSGPREILGGGAYGPLVSVHDEQTLARAILDVLEDPIDGATLRKRASEFSVEQAVDRYERIIAVTSNQEWPKAPALE